MTLQTGLSHATASGFMPILELLADVDDVDPNLADNDGNTPLIFAAQAGNFCAHSTCFDLVRICGWLAGVTVRTWT